MTDSLRTSQRRACRTVCSGSTVRLGSWKGFGMFVWEKRKRQRASVEVAYEQLKDCLAGEFAPGYFNSPRVLAEENDGLGICDAVLGRALATSPNVDVEAKALELLNRVSRDQKASEVANRCHNLRGACALMLDQLHVLVVMVWGSVFATDEEGRAFWLNAWDGLPSQENRPGHSWLMTPSWRVADLALAHQADVPGDYDEIRAALGPVITVSSCEASEPDLGWWRFAGGQRLTATMYAGSTLYHDVIGWSQDKLGSMTVRYLPGAMTLPKEADLADVNIMIGGLSPREFFDRFASDLVPPLTMQNVTWNLAHRIRAAWKICERRSR